MPQITVLYFAAATTATGLTVESVDLPDTTPFMLSNLTELLIARHRNSTLEKVLKTSRWSVDAEMVEDPIRFALKGGEEVAVICPVSGG
jgi:molybdopterin converting factor small subunit